MSAGAIKEFYHSQRWKRCRQAYLNSLSTHICQRCGVELGTEVHHIEELTTRNVTDDSISLNFENLMLLCKNCHNTIHGRQDKGRTRVIFINGYPVEQKKEGKTL